MAESSYTVCQYHRLTIDRPFDLRRRRLCNPEGITSHTIERRSLRVRATLGAPLSVRKDPYGFSEGESTTSAGLTGKIELFHVLH